MKKILALVLALAMIATLGLAFASEVTNAHVITITKNNATGARNYEAYQILKGNLNAAENILADIEWGTNITTTTAKENLLKAAGLTTDKTAADFAKAISGYSSAQLDQLAVVIGQNLSGDAAGTSTNDGTNASYTIPVSGDGYYFIKDVTANIPEGETASKYMVSVVKNLTIKAKDNILTPDKTETTQDPSQVKVKDGTAAIGDVITFDVDITVPDTNPYKRFWFVMNDQLPTGMTYTGLTSIKILSDPEDDTTAVTYAGQYTSTPAAVTGTTEEIVAADGGQKLEIVFKEFKSVVETNGYIGKTMRITYTAVVNDDAVFGNTGNINEVEFKYSNDPTKEYEGDNGEDPTGKTPKSTTETDVTALQINKRDGATRQALAGAEFEISSEDYNVVLEKGERFVPNAEGAYYKLLDGTYTTTVPGGTVNDTQYVKNGEAFDRYDLEEYEEEIRTPGESKKVTVITDANGVIKISGLKPGTYTVKETKAPDGYNLLDDTYTLVIDWGKDGNTYKFFMADGTTAGWSLSSDGALFSITIDNNKGTTLPSTGGIGTTIFYILGGLLVIGAAVILVARRKAQD